jgi:hypothetical protein
MIASQRRPNPSVTTNTSEETVAVLTIFIKLANRISNEYPIDILLYIIQRNSQADNA